MRRHPDELVGRYRLGDTGCIRRYFESNPDEFDDSIWLYRIWKDADAAWEIRDWAGWELNATARLKGADPGEWRCVLRCAVARLDAGLPCPPWSEGES